MTNSQVTQPKLHINTGQVVGGGILIGIGGIMALAGLAVAGTALVTAYRERIGQMDVPPTELARKHWIRMKAATAAGVGEWRNGLQPAESGSR
jgi:hypothetical protein